MSSSQSGDKTRKYSIFSMSVLYNLQVRFTLYSCQKKQKLRITDVIRNFCLICDFPQVLLSVNQCLLSCSSGDVVAPSSKSVTT